MDLLKKEFAGLPVWGWGLIAIAGVGAGILIIKWRGSSSSTSGETSSATQAVQSQPSSESYRTATTTTPGTDMNGTIWPETSVNGQNVPVIPPGYQAIYDNIGNLIGYEPMPVPTPTPTPTPTPGTGGANMVTVVASGQLASTPGGTNNKGVNLASLAKGVQVTLLGGPVTFGGNHYYHVSYNGQDGYVRSTTIGLGTGGHYAGPRRRRTR